MNANKGLLGAMIIGFFAMLAYYIYMMVKNYDVAVAYPSLFSIIVFLGVMLAVLTITCIVLFWVIE